MVGLFTNGPYCQQSCQLWFSCLAGLLTISHVILIKRILIKKKQGTWEQKSRSWVDQKWTCKKGGSQSSEPSPFFARGPLWHNSILPIKYKIGLSYRYNRYVVQTCSTLLPWATHYRSRLAAPQPWGPLQICGTNCNSAGGK